MKITGIDFYDDEVGEAFQIQLESTDGKTLEVLDIRPTDKGYTVYNLLGNELYTIGDRKHD